MMTSSNPSLAGGVQEHVIALSNELRKRGHSVTVHGPKPKGKLLFTHYKHLGEKVYFPLPNGTHSNVHLLTENDKPEVLLNPKKYDILHIHEPYIPFAAWNVLEKNKVPVVATFHTVWDNESFFNIFNQLIPLFSTLFSNYTQGAIYVSTICYEKWHTLCNSSVMQRIIPNAVDTSLFVPKKRKNKKVALLFVARLVHRKGLLRLLKALTLLKKSTLDFTLTILGDGDEREEDFEYIRTHKLGGFITYLGEVTGKKRAQYFKSADVFCAPYTNEASSLSVLEAVSAGLPVVGYNIPIFSDILKDYPGKSLLVSKNEEALANGLHRIITDEALRTSLLQWCMVKRNSFSWQTIAKQTEELYYQVIQKK